MNSTRALGGFEHGSKLRQAVDDCLKGGDRHWTGLTRMEMIARIQQRMKNRELGAMLRAYWSALSARAHPRARLGERVHLIDGGIRIVLDPDFSDEAPAAVAEASARTAATLLRKHLTPSTNGG